MHFANCVTLAAVLLTTLIENLKLFSSAEAEILLNLQSCSLGQNLRDREGPRL